MATTVYDSLSGDASKSMNLLASSTIGYPSSNLYNVFGPVYLPRIYGKDLSAFEIASSGKVSITLQDTWALDIDRNIAASNTFLQTIPGDSFTLMANSNQISVKLDATTNNLNLTASNNLVFTAQKIVYNVTGDSTSVSGGNQSIASTGSTSVVAQELVTVASTASSVSVTSANSNVSILLDATSCNLVEYALHNILATASNDYALHATSNASFSAAQGSILMSAAASNVSMRLSAATMSAALAATSNVSLTSVSGAVSASAATGLTLTTASGSITSTAPNAQFSLSNGVFATTSGPMVTTSSSLQETASNSGFLNVLAGPLAFTAAASNTQMVLGATGATLSALSNIVATTSNNFAVTATQDVTLQSLLGSMYMYDSSNASIALSNNSIAINARSNVQITASNLILSTYSTTSLVAMSGSLGLNSAGASVDIGALSNVNIAASNGSISMVAAKSNAIMNLDAASYNVSIYAASNVLATSSNNTSIVANKDLSLVAHTGVLTMTAAANYSLTTLASAACTATNNYSMTATNGAMALSAPSSNMTLTAGTYALTSSGNILNSGPGIFQAAMTSNVTLTSASSSVAFSADADKVTLKLDKPTDSILGYALSNTTLTSGQNFTVTASNLASVSAKTSLTLSSAAGGASLGMGADSKFIASGYDYTFNATNSVGYNFNIGSSNLVTMQADRMIINGGLDIYGTVNSIAVTNQNLQVNDHTVSLCYPQTGTTLVDGVANTASGIVVFGLPATASNYDATLGGKIYQKSLEWNYGSAGIDGMRTIGGISTESYWEMKGGRFQLTSTKSDGTDITFGLRINEQDELEMIKIYIDGSSVKQTKRIAKFGRTIM